jgi:hypothetical protein
VAWLDGRCDLECATTIVSLSGTDLGFGGNFALVVAWVVVEEDKDEEEEVFVAVWPPPPPHPERKTVMRRASAPNVARTDGCARADCRSVVMTWGAKGKSRDHEPAQIK